MDKLSLLTPEVKFDFFSAELLKAVEVGGKKILHGVASSTTKDLHGDTILKSALEDMERTALGMTIFLNHSYNVPDDVGGTVTKAIIKQQGVDGNGDPNWSLIFDIEVEDDNPQALRAWSFIKKGRKLGLSIGAMIPEGGAKRQKDGTYVIEHVNLLETSIVGIPANPKSWVDYAASALRGLVSKAKTTDLGNPTLTLEGGKYKIEGSIDAIGGLDLGAELNSPDTKTVDGVEVTHSFSQAVDGKTVITRSSVEPADEAGMAVGKFDVLGAWDLSDADDLLLAKAAVGEDIIAKATVWVETRDGDKITIGEPVETDGANAINNDAKPDVTEAACPTCGKGKDSSGCSDAYHKAAPDPDVADAKVRIIEVDTDDQSSGDGQGASSSEPDDADTLAAPTADVTAAAEPVILDGLTEDQLVQLSFDQLRTAALAVVTQLSETKRLLEEEKTARIGAETQRDAVIEAAAQLVQRTASVIEKVANSPLPRKAAIRSAQKEFSATVEGYYGEEFARALARTET